MMVNAWKADRAQGRFKIMFKVIQNHAPGMHRAGRIHVPMHIC